MNKTNIEWCDYTVNPIIFETLTKEGYGCPYRCRYPCYTGKIARAFPKAFTPGFYPFRIKGKMKGKTIFVESMGDLFHPSVEDREIEHVFERCQQLDPSNTFVFLTKNSPRYETFLPYYQDNFIWGVTLETNVYSPNWHISDAPQPYDRVQAMKRLPERVKRMDSVEPSLDFNSSIFLRYLLETRALFIIFGANSMDTRLPEPPPEKLRALIQALRGKNQTVLIKENAKRLGLIPYHFKISHIPAELAKKRQKSLEAYFNEKAMRNDIFEH